MKKLLIILIIFQAISSTAQSIGTSNKCFSSETKRKIAQKLEQYSYCKKITSKQASEIFELNGKITALNIKNKSLIDENKKQKNIILKKAKQLDISKEINKNQKEQTKIAKKKKAPTFLKGVITGGVVVLILKIIL